MAEQQGKIYLVSEEQFQSLKSARSPEIQQTVSAIEQQSLGSGALKARVAEQVKAAVDAAVAKMEEAKAGAQKRAEDYRSGTSTD